MAGQNTSLPNCVASLQSSLDSLSSSIKTLDSGVNDFPRLAKVLQTTRHYELLPESTLINAQSSLLSTLTPELDSMLSRVDAYLDKLQRREAGLMAKYELQADRLASRRRPSSRSHSQSRQRTSSTASLGARAGAEQLDSGGTGVAVAAKAADEAREALRRKQIRQKKERLSYAVDRLALQAQEKERQLRQSMVKGPN